MAQWDSQCVSYAQSDANEPKNWLALTVRPQHESAASSALESFDIETYVPFYQERRRWSDRYKTIQAPLIPGYVFARFDEAQRATVLRCQNVRSIVQFGRQLAQIPDSELDCIRALIGSGLPVEPRKGIVPGTKVRIETGPLAGVCGVFLRRNNQQCLAVSVELLGRSVIAAVDQTAVFPLQATNLRFPPAIP